MCFGLVGRIFSGDNTCFYDCLFWFVFTLQSGGVYMFSNLIGCDGERVFYDGGSMISVNGQIIAEGPQ